MNRHTDVYFEFVSAEHEATTARGSVIDRGNEMVLELRWEESTYLIAGRKSAHYFSGSGAGVEAEWAQVGRAFVGLWVEDGDEWFFRFVLRTGGKGPNSV